jgi:ectoine hydroxylase-related dioxygenase (phytanoyl-CoA dioxygenase family)
MIARALTHATPLCVSQYQQLGAVYIPQVLTPAEVECLTMGIDFNLKNLSHRSKIASTKSDTGCFIEDFCTWQDNPYYQKILFETPLGAIANRLMNSTTARLHHDHLLVKEPFTQQITPWHQDQPYYHFNGQQNCSFWIPVDPIEQTSTLQLVANSHQGTWYMPRSFMNNQAQWFKEGSLPELPDDATIRANHVILSWAMQPGDVVAFHMLTVHSASGVLNHQRRRVFSLRCLGDDATYAKRSWPTSPDFPELHAILQHGDPMHHALFPILDTLC